MNGVVNGVYFCQNNRTTALSNRMYERNVPSEQLSMTYGPRPVPTRLGDRASPDASLHRHTPDRQHPVGVRRDSRSTARRCPGER